jgi:hypothetical protein
MPRITGHFLLMKLAENKRSEVMRHKLQERSELKFASRIIPEVKRSGI